jgi:hypothetical protein
VIRLWTQPSELTVNSRPTKSRPGRTSPRASGEARRVSSR